MKVEAVVRTSRLGEIVNRLRLIGVPGMTISEAHGMSASTGTPMSIMGQRMTRPSSPRYHVMIVVRDEDVAHIVAAIVHSGCTNAPGDGIVTVTDIEGVLRIRTDEVDLDAI